MLTFLLLLLYIYHFKPSFTSFLRRKPMTTIHRVVREINTRIIQYSKVL